MKNKEQIKENKPLTKPELLETLKNLHLATDQQRNEITCTLIGHSKICTIFFGYRYCGRCKVQLGDSLGSIDFGADKAVFIGHNCDQCKTNYEKCTWQDKLFVQNPFKEEIK